MSLRTIWFCEMVFCRNPNHLWMIFYQLLHERWSACFQNDCLKINLGYGCHCTTYYGSVLEEPSLIMYVLDFVEESTGVLRKAESEYKGHRSLLMRTRNLLSTMQRQDVIERFKEKVLYFFFLVPNDYINLQELTSSYIGQGDTCIGIFLILLCCSLCRFKAYWVTKVTETDYCCHKGRHGWSSRDQTWSCWRWYKSGPGSSWQCSSKGRGSIWAA